MRRAEISSQVFVYIMTAVIVSLVVLFSAWGVYKLTHKVNQVELDKFKLFLETDIKKAAYDYGSVRQIRLVMPAGFDEICFVDFELIGNVPADKHFVGHVVMEDSVRSGANANVFLYPKGLETLQAGKLDIKAEDTTTPTYICIKAKAGVVNLRAEGLGDRARISEWQDV